MRRHALVDLPSPFVAPADIVIPPHPRALTLSAPPDVQWSRASVRGLAWRIAGRVLDLDGLPSDLADELLNRVLEVLDWAAS